MKDNNYFEDLIVSYLLKELNAEEKVFVLEWVNSNEHNKKYFEEIKNTYRLFTLKQSVEYIDTDLEWYKFKEEIAPKQNDFADKANVSSKEYVSKEEQLVKGGNIYKILLSTAVAASIMLVVVFAWKFIANTPLQERVTAGKTINESGLNAPVKRGKINTLEKHRYIILPDGSEVKLYKNSEIIFDDPLISNKREVILTGKANFKVAKDKSKPFTVHSGDISTTALGTEFTVTAVKNHKIITVRLYEGKVVVKSSTKAKRKLNKNFYLVPGQEFVYDNARGAGMIRKFNSVTKTPVNERKEVNAIDNPLVPNVRNGSWFMFNNQPLDQVFEQLKNMYNVDIVYSNKDVSKIYFIGTFNNSDSVDIIINQIAILNNLKVSKKNNKIIISKKQ